MELLAVLFIAALVLMIVLSRSSETNRLIEDLRSRVAALENELRPSRGVLPTHIPESNRPPVPAAPIKPATPPPLRPVSIEHLPTKPPAATPLESPPIAPPSTPSTAPTHPVIDWEEFMGAKLFAWIGGLALFLGIAFFVKYSFDHNLIPPQVRVAIGFAAGVALLAGGLLMKRKENAVTAQTLCATGILVLYAVTFACRSYYHFAFFGPVETFGIMALVTAVAFLLSVRMNALVIAILGVAGGFLTPVLLSTGQDNPLALFGYIALLDIGLLAIAQRRQWKALPALGAAGTILTEAAWLASFFAPEHYAFGNKALIPMAVLAGFQVLFLAAAWWAARTGRENHSPGRPALAAGAAAFLATFYFLSYTPLGHRPILLCSYLFLVDLGLIALSLAAKRFALFRSAAGTAAFIFLGAWTQSYLTAQLLPAALGCYFVFALLHSALPLILQRYQKTTPPLWTHIFPVLSLALVLMPVFQLRESSMLIWPFVLLVDALAFMVAMVTMTLAPVLLVLLLTLVTIGGALLQIPAALTGLPTDLFLLGGFALFFIVAGSWAARRLTPEDAGPPRLLGSINHPANLAVQLPAMSAILPFLLLILVTIRLPLHDPSPVFALALLLVLILLGLARVLSLDALPVVALVSALALEHAWVASPAGFERPMHCLPWYLAFYGVFTAFPFIFRSHFAGKKAPWIASALAGPSHFYLVHETVKAAFPRMEPGILPALFAIPSLLGLASLARRHASPDPARDAQLALFGGAALFFITLIFPLQFDRQWITISWALEGAALCWLFHRVPHPGLRLAGVLLLTVAFARTGLNPLILTYHARAAYPFLNWYLYAFGVVSLALFASARLLASPRNLVAEINTPPLLYSMGTFLMFLLLNIEIADYFTAPGAPVLTFEFSGNFARDMSYSIAWALFALLLLIIGLWKRNAAVRYAGLALLAVAVLKLFLHDLSQLDQLYRVGAFIAVAIIAIFASFLYQRFLALPPHDGEAAPPPIT